MKKIVLNTFLPRTFFVRRNATISASAMFINVATPIYRVFTIDFQNSGSFKTVP